jgi:hypothetical protein
MIHVCMFVFATCVYAYLYVQCSFMCACDTSACTYTNYPILFTCMHFLPFIPSSLTKRVHTQREDLASERNMVGDRQTWGGRTGSNWGGRSDSPREGGGKANNWGEPVRGDTARESFGGGRGEQLSRDSLSRGEHMGRGEGFGRAEGFNRGEPTREIGGRLAAGGGRGGRADAHPVSAGPRNARAGSPMNARCASPMDEDSDEGMVEWRTKQVVSMFVCIYYVCVCECPQAQR